ncbi:ARSJ-like protein [Mya arenaria]|uniref:ARSJ-like protein n=1 Tax=Mya arenaria TaxID=6604 RepID=A0ABY7G7J9_MYAAR|nr:ARSJ-like protein [Mya arenaria]
MFTPNLDKMARAGVILNSSYVQPHDVIHPSTPGYLPANFTTLPQKLKHLGYTTHMVGKMCGCSIIFQLELQLPYRTSFLYVFVNAIRKDSAECIFCRWHLGFCNWKYTPTYRGFDSFMGYYNGAEDYYTHVRGMVSALDEAVGNITSALRDRGFMNNALIVFTTDNGGAMYTTANNMPLRGAKWTLWEGGTRGAAFVYSDNLLQKTGYTNNEMIHAVDWFPTLLTLAGGKPDAGMDGVNQWPTLSSGTSSARSEFVYNIDDIDNNAAIRVGQYKLIEGSPGEYNDWTPLPPLTASDMFNASFPEHQLFDLNADPTEHHDIASDHPDVVSKLLDRLRFHKATMVPANNPPDDPASNPKNFGGNWSPGWC